LFPGGSERTERGKIRSNQRVKWLSGEKEEGGWSAKAGDWPQSRKKNAMFRKENLRKKRPAAALQHWGSRASRGRKGRKEVG